MADYDPRIVDLYDGDDPDGVDHDYYRSLAADSGARRILDIGCGTGILTVTFAASGRTVIGVDPSAAMVAYVWGGRGTSRTAPDAAILLLRVGRMPSNVPALHGFWQAFSNRYPHGELRVRYASFTDPFGSPCEGARSSIPSRRMSPTAGACPTSVGCRCRT